MTNKKLLEKLQEDVLNYSCLAMERMYKKEKILKIN